CVERFTLPPPPAPFLSTLSPRYIERLSPEFNTHLFPPPPSAPNPHTYLMEYTDNSFIQYRPSSHRTLACISAFLCFWPVGIASLVYSCRAQCAKSDGDFRKAGILGKYAKDLAIASIILGIVLLIILILVIVLMFLPMLRSG
ncbi:unnamed protein product, partial [Candidula unifasciata]